MREANRLQKNLLATKTISIKPDAGESDFLSVGRVAGEKVLLRVRNARLTAPVNIHPEDFALSVTITALALTPKKYWQIATLGVCRR